MPTYRSITISLISQFDILTIPEYAPPTIPTDPFSNAPMLVNPDHSLVSVYIPTYPSSQFWLSYSISPPHPPKLLYYFKLYLNGKLVVSWGCGEDDDYRGKTMFGLFKPNRTSGLAKGATLQRRVLCFGPDIDGLDNRALDNLSDVMEIKVFRSKARKRIEPDVQTLQSVGFPPSIDKKTSHQQAAGGIHLVNAGILADKHPQRYYKYALLDPLDVPFATFRYYYRSWDQLEALGVISPYPSESSSVTSIDSSPARSQQNLAISAERPVSTRDDSNALESDVTVSASSDDVSTNSASHMAEDPDNNSTAEAATATNPNKTSLEEFHSSKNPREAIVTRATDDDSESHSSPNSPKESPLKIPFFLPRPPTPPPSPAPPKLAKSPSSIPPVVKDFNTLTPKESFASLIRNRLPDPDPSAFKLNDPAESDKELPSPSLPTSDGAGSLSKRNGTGSMGVLMSVVNSAKSRRRRQAGAGSAASEDEPSEGERTDGETGESVSVGSGSDGSGKARDRSVGRREKKRAKEERRREREEERREKEKKRREEREEEEEEDGKRPEERRRRRNLWEEL